MANTGAQQGAGAAVCFIVNPVAGSGMGKAAVPIIERTMRGAGASAGAGAGGASGAGPVSGPGGGPGGGSGNGAGYKIVYTDKPDDFERVAAMVGPGAETIACVGGDGTVQEYLGLAVGRGVKFGVIPAGSANDLLLSTPAAGGGLETAAAEVCGGAGRAAAKPKFKTFEEKIAYYTKKVAEGNSARVDAIAVNGCKYCLNIAGTGIDIQVLKDALPIKKYFGGAAYFFSLMKNVFTYRADSMGMTVDGKAEAGEVLLLAVCNGAYYGGNLKIAPPARVDDGLITLCKISKMPRAKMVAIFPAVKPGRHAGFKEVSFTNCSTVKIEFQGTRTLNLDGNLIEYGSPITFSALKGAVNLII